MSNTVPAFGYAVVRIVEPGTSEAGLDLSAAPTVQTEFAGLYLVRASEGHMQEGIKVPCVIPVGAKLYLAPSRRMAPNPHKRGEFYEQEYLRILKVPGARLEEHERMVMLCDVFAWEPPGREGAH